MALVTFAVGDTDYINSLNALGVQAEGNETTLAAIEAGSAFSATSTTSLAIGLGNKTFTLAETGRAWAQGSVVRATSTANNANFMQGVVNSYSGTTIIINMNLVGGSGTAASWSLTNAVVAPSDAPTLVSTSQTLVSGGDYAVNTAGITLTLPASPSAGDYVAIKDATGNAEAATFIVARNGSNIASSATDLIFDKNFAEIVMIYVNGTIGWSV